MKKSILLSALIFISVCTFSQPGNKPKPKEKPPTQKEMEDMMKEAEKMMGEMSPEDKKMMDSLGIKMPDMNKLKKDAAGISDKQLAEAWENENRIVPKRDAVRIAAIPHPVTEARIGAYIASIQNNIASLLKPEVKSMGDKIYSYIKANSKNNAEAGNMATAFWIAGKPELSLYVLGKICAVDAGNTDNISNYASMLSMLGAEHLAIPLLNNLNAKFPRNSTLLNNLGQAWFGLGEIGKAEKYLDSTIRIYAFHPQANMTKAAIEESKGNKDHAIEAVKKSMQHAYTKEKEEKLTKLGQKISYNDFRLPKRTKADPMNLGSFQSPAFPKSVEECIVAKKEWDDFYRQLENKNNQLLKLKKQADEIAIKGHEQRLNADLALVKTAMANPGTKGQFVAVPMYAARAEKKYKAYTDLYNKKLEAFSMKAKTIMGEATKLKVAYDEQMEKLREEDGEQTGEGLPNKDFCPQYKGVSDKFLAAVNPKFEQLYSESLKLQKEFLNESAYWYLYIQWPDMYEASKLSFQMGWLGALKDGPGISGFASGYPFVSITEYVCNAQAKQPQKTELKKFDDINCKYNDTTDLKIMTFYHNCSRMTSKFNMTFIEYTRYDDFERAEGDTYTGCTIKISAEAGKDLKAGPLKVEAKIGVGVELELDINGVKDVNLVGEIKVGAGTHVLDEYKGPVEEKGIYDREGIGIAGKDAFPTTVEIGAEGRISIFSGHVKVTGSGVLKDMKVAEWK